MIKGFGAACAAVALGVAPAQAACWNADETAAATVRELQSVLMVAALRCQVAHHEITEDYNVFLRANRYTIQQMNDRLKAHFIKAGGAAKGQTAYDAFTTSLANGHGAEGASAEVCDGMGALAREAGLMAGSAEGLLLLAARQGLAISLPEGECARPAMTMALAAPAAVIATAAVADTPSSASIASVASEGAALPQPVMMAVSAASSASVVQVGVDGPR